MRARQLVLCSLALSAVVGWMIACSSSKPTCRPNTLALAVQLSGNAVAADTIEVSFSDPNSPGSYVTQSTPHVPEGESFFTIDVSFPSGYPADRLVLFHVRALAGEALLGERVEQIHLLPGCSPGSAVLGGGTLDGGPTDGGPSD